MKYFSFKNILFSLLLFSILYFEDIAIAGIRIAQIWKLPFYFYAIHFVFKKIKLNHRKLLFLFILGLLISLKIILNAKFEYGLLENLAEAFYLLTLPVSIPFFYYKYRNQPQKLNYILVCLALFLIISNIPFILKLLPQKNSSFSLEKFGLYDKFALNGLFYHTSITSKILVISTIILVPNYMLFVKHKFEKYLMLCVIILGFYSIYLCYTRTGWLMLIIGLLILFVYKEKLNKLFLKVFPLLFVVGFFLLTYIQNDNDLLLRLRGGTTYRQNTEFNSEVFTSYRLVLFEHAINNLVEEGAASVILGSGKKNATEKMGKIMGTNFVAHNRFIELFQYGGFIALFLFLIFLIALYKLIKSFPILKGFYISKLPFTIFILYIFSMIPSHGFPIWADILFGGYIALNIRIKENEQLKLIKINNENINNSL